MKKLFFLFILIGNLSFGAEPPFWSKTGHRVVGEVAQQHLTGKTKRALKKLLNGESLAGIANFSDEIKSDSRYRKFGPWHYVNIPPGKTYADITPPKGGDIITGIAECTRIVKDKNSSLEDRVFYLKMLVHLIGDLHQPMHVGRAEDKGGNDFQVEWFRNGTNLHRVWDSHMIDDNKMSYTEMANNLPVLTKTEVLKIQEGTPVTWAAESQLIVDAIYKDVNIGDKLSYRYSYDWWSTVENQLQKGGLRLANVLNELF